MYNHRSNTSKNVIATIVILWAVAFSCLFSAIKLGEAADPEQADQVMGIMMPLLTQMQDLASKLFTIGIICLLLSVGVLAYGLYVANKDTKTW